MTEIAGAPSPEIDDALASLSVLLPGMDTARFVVHLLEIAARFGDEQTSIAWQDLPTFELTYPLKFTWFREGLIVTATDAAHSALYGLRLAQIDESPVDAILARLRMLVPQANPNLAYSRVPQFLASPALLHSLGLIKHVEAATFTLVDATGRYVHVDLSPLPPSTAIREPSPTMEKEVPHEGLPLADNYWFEMDTDRRILYLNHRRCESLVGLPFEEFVGDLLTVMDEHSFRALIVDLRDNRGGREDQVGLLLDGLQSRPTFLQPGAVLVLVGPGTQGAAIGYARTLHNEIGAVIISGPEAPTSQGSDYEFLVTLPESGLQLFRRWRPDGQPALPIDRFVLPSTHGLMAGKDPLLETIIDALPPLASKVLTPSAEPTDGLHADRPTRSERWQQDLAALVKLLHATADALGSSFGAVDTAEFTRAASELGALIPNIEDHKVVVGMMRLTAMFDDAHTRVVYWEWEAFDATQSPIKVQWFEDALYITAVQPGFETLLGQRIVEIEGWTPAQIHEALASIISHENAYGLRASSETMIVRPVILHALGVIRDLNRVSITVRDVAGRDTTRVLPVITPGNEVAGWVPAIAPDDVPLWLGRSEKTPYWYTILPESSTLFFQYNACIETPDRPYEPFLDELFSAAAAKNVQRLVIDLRRNEGGLSQVLAPLMVRLREHPEFTQSGRFFVLVGRRTFSTAAFLAGLLREQTEAVLIGEPLGQGLPFYAGAETLVLPNSGLRIQYPTRLWEVGGTPAKVVRPDIEVVLTFTDYIVGRDPVLAAALAYETPSSNR